MVIKVQQVDVPLRQAWLARHQAQRPQQAVIIRQLLHRGRPMGVDSAAVAYLPRLQHRAHLVAVVAEVLGHTDGV